jgi:hypothetical protein
LNLQSADIRSRAWPDNRQTDGTPQRWQPETLCWSQLDAHDLRRDEALFVLIGSASFVESGSDVYSGNLASMFADDPEVGGWLRREWEPEELQHGHALRMYVQRVWPEFDWMAAHRDFMSEYSRLCAVELYEPTRAQELAARCIVEMGTTTYYQALNAAVAEPVLRQLTALIRADEVRHYKHFYAYFRQYQRVERQSVLRVAGSLLRRLLELRSDDADVAMRHVIQWGRRAGVITGGADEVRQLSLGLISAHLPVDLAVRMSLKPLQIGSVLRRTAEKPVSAIVRRLVFH